MTLFHNKEENLMFLSSCSCNCTDFFIVQWISSILGYVMNALYEFLDVVGIANIGLCIIIFTIIVKLLLLPMTIKQQKFTKLSSVMNPELKAIQKKYAGKSDQDSMLKMREETNAVYEKYGTSASGGCLQLLIQMPIIFALYAVINSIPAYVGDVEEMYRAVSKVAYESVDEYKEFDTISKLIGKENEEFSNIVKLYYTSDKDKAIDTIYDQFRNLNIDSWAQFEKMCETSKNIVKDIKDVSDEDWDKLIKENKDDKELLEKYKNLSNDELDSIIKGLEQNEKLIDKTSEPINEVYEFAGINLSKSPSHEVGQGIWWALLIPILSALTQFLSVKISQARNGNTGAEDNPMIQSMNTTMMFMPLMSAFFCYTFQSGLGLYWVISSVVQIVQQIFINMYFDKLDVNDIIKMNIEKVNKKREAQGLPPRKITTVANANVKNIKYDNTTATKNSTTQNPKSVSSSGKAPAASGTGKKMGIAAKANMVKEFNEKNSKK